MTITKSKEPTTLAEVLATLDNKEKREGKYKCPVCNEWRLVVTEKPGKVLVSCKTPTCPQGAAWKEITEKHNGDSPTQKAEDEWPGLTLVEFAQKKGLKEEWLRGFGVFEMTYTGKHSGWKPVPVVCFPYGEETREGISEEITIPLTGAKIRVPTSTWVHTATKIRGGTSHQTRWENGENDKKILKPFGLCLRWLLRDGDLMLVERESDTITAAVYGIPALGISGVDNWKPEFAQIPRIRDAERIFILKEPDEGEKFVQKIREDRGIPAEKVYVVPFPADAPDLNALHLQCLKAAPPVDPPTPDWYPTGIASPDDEKELIEYRRKLIESGEWNPRASEDLILKRLDELFAKAKPLVGNYTLRSLADVEMKDVKWLWPGRVPAGKLSIFAGETGTGKSMVSCSLAAMVTKQKDFPDGANENPPMDVLMLFCEDDVEDTVAPRLVAAGADRKRIYEIRISVGEGAGAEERMLAFNTDRARLEAMLRDHPEIKLVIVDPISSFIGVNMNKEQEVRSVLEPLAAIAKRTGVSFVLIAHLNKRADVNALNKIMGAVAIQGATRAAWLFTEDRDDEEDPDDEEDREPKFLMLYGKVNLGRRQKGLEYTMSEKEVAGLKDKQPYIKWGGLTNKTANDAIGSLGAFGDKGGVKVAIAGKWLKGFLGDSAKPAKDVYEAAKEEGIKERMLKTVKKELGVVTNKVVDAWYWRMPED